MSYCVVDTTPFFRYIIYKKMRFAYQTCAIIDAMWISVEVTLVNGTSLSVEVEVGGEGGKFKM